MICKIGQLTAPLGDAIERGEIKVDSRGETGINGVYAPVM